MIKINMFSSADKVKGQGVGSAYLELIAMLKRKFPDSFDIAINSYSKADISHYHTVDPWFYLSTFSRKKRGKTVGYVHFLPETLEGSIELFSPFQKVFNWYVVSFYKRMDELVVVNPSFISKLEGIGISKDKVTYIPNFVSTEVFHEEPEEKRMALRQKLGYDEKDFVVLGAGQIQQRKGIDDFIQLAEENPDISFVWAGGFSFGKITDGYDRYKKVYDNPPKNLTFTGIIERHVLADLYNAADVFLLPSYNELFPMSILEGFNCGTPVMLRNLELYEAIIKDYYLGTDDVTDMSRALNRLYRQREELEVYRRKSREAAAFYSEENVASLWAAYYNRLLLSESSVVSQKT
ncbi:glycosyltransferase family 4 protein [Vagococcus acidifermentans]|uniref:Glycosyltransferase n=1 Tax=Vagococcus acidifermentans TaxID=564710 RepID=A0A430AVG7_9ENTE|nr:glycosyltransferase family 4 protein [Vagococcus acidifermentans]RSU12045.1 glycosyltransferase [Vagococcus acidifermentans]